MSYSNVTNNSNVTNINNAFLYVLLGKEAGSYDQYTSEEICMCICVHVCACVVRQQKRCVTSSFASTNCSKKNVCECLDTSMSVLPV